MLHMAKYASIYYMQVHKFLLGKIYTTRVAY